MSRFSPCAIACALVSLSFATTAPAQTNPYTWQLTTSGNFNTAANWLNGAAVVEVPPSNAATQLVFNAGGALTYVATNNIGAATFTLNSMTFNNTSTTVPGIVLAGAAAANTYTFAGTNPSITMTGGGVNVMAGLMAGTATVTVSGNGVFAHNSSNGAAGGFTGTIIINSGTFANTSDGIASTTFNAVSIVVNNGGTYQFGNNTVGDPNLPNTSYITANPGGLVICQEGEQLGGLHLQGGTIDLQLGSFTPAGATVQSWTSGTLTATGAGAFVIGQTTAITKTTAGVVTVTGNASITTSGGVTIQDGTITHVNAGNLGTSNITLGAAATAGVFEHQGLTASRVGNFTGTGLGGEIRVTNAATALTLTGAFAGTGPISKTGPGTLNHTGAISNTSTLFASQGVLRLNPVAATANLSIGAGATLAANSGAGTTSLTAPSLAFAAANSVLQIDYNTAVLPTAAAVSITGANAVTLGAGATLRFTNLQTFANGLHPALDYTGTPITTGFTLQLPGRTAGDLVYDTANTLIAVNITGTDTVRWDGNLSDVWDIGSAPNVGGTNNWKLVSGLTSTNFIQTDNVTFNDLASSFHVNIDGTVLPSAVTVSATGSFLFTTSTGGKISGATGLTKSLGGNLTLTTDNDYSGLTVLNAGTLQLGNGGATGSIISPVTINGGTLAFQRLNSFTLPGAMTIGGSFGIHQAGSGAITIASALALGTNNLNVSGTGDLTLPGIVSGTGTIDMNGTGTVTMLANNLTFTGTININSGTLLLDDLGASGDLGATLITANANGKFVFGANGNADFPNTTFILIQGGEADFQQAEQFGATRLAGGVLRVTGNGTQGFDLNMQGTGVPFAGFAVESGSIITTNTGATPSSLTGSATNTFTKSTAGTVTITGSFTWSSAMPVNINEGTLSLQGQNVPVSTGALSLGTATTSGTLLLSDGATVTTPRTVTINAFGGDVNVADAAGRLTFSGNVTGAGGLRKLGPGTLILSGVNSYGGSTVVQQGDLAVTNSNLGVTAPVIVSGGRLRGTGSIGGPVTVSTGAIRGGNSIGTLTLAAGMSVGAGARIEVEIADGSTPSGAPGGSTIGILPNPTSNSFLEILAGGATISNAALISVDGTNASFTLFQPYSYQIARGAGDQSLLNIVDAQITAIGFGITPGSASLTGNASGAIFVNFTPIPEPAGLLVLAGLLGFIRRRR